jgi:hypothetical protein
MFEPRIKIDRVLYERLEKAARLGGYATTPEFILHILEKAAEAVADTESEEAVRQRLQGLGYLG